MIGDELADALNGKAQPTGAAKATAKANDAHFKRVIADIAC